jgi:hypothetical protein
LPYEGQSADYSRAIEYMNYGFTGVFVVELILKLVAFGFKGFWISPWNKFDLFVVIASVVDIVMDNLGGSATKFLRVGP